LSLSIVAPQVWWDWRGAAPQTSPTQVGNFTLLLDEQKESDNQKEKEKIKPKRTSGWR
jgi:hypothetical protein